MIQQIATVAVYVDDQERALEFWRDRMGFEMRRRESIGKAGSWLEVAPKGAGSRLVLYPKSLMTNWQQLKPSIVFECDDLQAAWRYGPKAWSSWASSRRWRGARTCCSARQTATSSSSEARSRSSACLSLLRPAFETVSPRLLCHSGMMKTHPKGTLEYRLLPRWRHQIDSRAGVCYLPAEFRPAHRQYCWVTQIP